MRKQSPGGWKHCKVHGLPKDVSCYPATMDCCHGIAMEFRTRVGRYSSVGEKDRNSYFKVKSLNFWMLVLTATQKISCELKQVRTFLLTKWTGKKKNTYWTLDLPAPILFKSQRDRHNWVIEQQIFFKVLKAF